MAEPKKRTNKSKKGMRRMHDKIPAPALVACEKCHEPKQSHTVCYNCGTYKNISVINFVKKEKIVANKEE